jgi:hypothetical protein
MLRFHEESEEKIIVRADRSEPAEAICSIDINVDHHFDYTPVSTTARLESSSG